jgi:formiminoglutamate deiminase
VTTTYLLERALLPGGVHDDVLVEISEGRFTSVEPGVLASGAERLPGLTLPGLANTHSHAFHRALRGRTQHGRGSFWTWREQMYAVAQRLEPDTYLALATATFREMVAAGITCVGEFHYLHHRPDGRPYDDPNAMGLALVEAARVAGLRITLLDTLYLSSGFGEPSEGAQVRYDDGSTQAWLERVAALRVGDHALLAGALHSVRALPKDPATALVPLAEWAAGRPLHVHLSEQVAENDGCVAAYGVSPTRLLADHGLLGPLTSAVHATHLDDHDVQLLGQAGAFVSFCPTTERDLGDGVGPGRRLADAGARLTLGSDSHAVIDLFEEMRAVELDERLASQQRGHWQAMELVRAATTSGHASLGWDDAGVIAVGQRADMVTVDLLSPRTAGTGADEHTAVFAAVAEDVTQTMVDGRIVFSQGERDEIGRALAQAIGKVGS